MGFEPGLLGIALPTLPDEPNFFASFHLSDNFRDVNDTFVSIELSYKSIVLKKKSLGK